MIYNLLNIREIHSRKKAVFNKKYTSDSGDIFIGEIDGRLKLLTAASEVENLSLFISEETIYPSQILQDLNNRFVTDLEKTNWNNKQSTLVSGTNIKTVNGESLLGSGNIVISSGGLTQQQVEGLK
jgi:hypothetical protein